MAEQGNVSIFKKLLCYSHRWRDRDFATSNEIWIKKGAKVDDWKKITFSEIFKKIVKQFSNKEAIIIKDRTVSYDELNSISDNLALAFIKMGIEKGDNVAIWLPNCLEWIFTFFALGKIGAVTVPINTRFKKNEVDYILKQSNSKILIMMDKFYETNYLEIIEAICTNLSSLDKRKFCC